MLIDDAVNKKFYAVKLKGEIVSPCELSTALAYTHLTKLTLTEQEEAKVVQVTADGKELLFG